MPRHHQNHWLHDKLYIVGKQCLEKTTTSCDMHAWKQYNKPAHCDDVYLTGFVKTEKVAAEIVKTGKFCHRPSLPSPVLLTQLRATHPLLDLSLGCLEMQALTASTLQFERPQWLHLCLCSSKTLAATFWRICSNIQCIK